MPQRLIASEDLTVVGAAGMYEARWRRCFEPNLAAVEAEKKKKTELVAGSAIGFSVIPIPSLRREGPQST